MLLYLVRVPSYLVQILLRFVRLFLYFVRMQLQFVRLLPQLVHIHIWCGYYPHSYIYLLNSCKIKNIANPSLSMQNRTKGGYHVKTEQQYFEQGISMAEYMDRMKTNLKEGSFEIYNNFPIDENDELIALLKEKKPHILAITEDWCGDAMLNNPIIRKIAEAAQLDIRCVYRDEDTDLIDRYLTNGGRAIPIYLFLDQNGQVIGKWGPRAPELQQMVVEARAKLPEKDDPTFEEKQKELYTTLQEKFVKDPQCAKWVYEDMKKVIIEMLS